MSIECKEFCDSHSGNIVKIEALEKKFDKLELELEKYKSYNEGKMDKFSSDIKDLTKDFSLKLEASIREIKEIISSKEVESNGKRWLLIGTIASPIVVILLQKVIEYFVK